MKMMFGCDVMQICVGLENLGKGSKFIITGIVS
jgi:hypothetical protein